MFAINCQWYEYRFPLDCIWMRPPWIWLAVSHLLVRRSYNMMSQCLKHFLEIDVLYLIFLPCREKSRSICCSSGRLYLLDYWTDVSHRYNSCILGWHQHCWFNSLQYDRSMQCTRISTNNKQTNRIYPKKNVMGSGVHSSTLDVLLSFNDTFTQRYQYKNPPHTHHNYKIKQLYH